MTTTPAATDTWLPIATHSTGTPISPAYAARARAMSASYPGGSIVPACQSRIARCTASSADCGGSPAVAVFRYVTSGRNSRCASESAVTGSGPA